MLSLHRGHCEKRYMHEFDHSSGYGILRPYATRPRENRNFPSNQIFPESTFQPYITNTSSQQQRNEPVIFCHVDPVCKGVNFQNSPQQMHSFEAGEDLESSKFRQLPCRTFISAGTCPYRDRCVYLHDPRVMDMNAKSRTRKKNNEDNVVDSLFWPVMPRQEVQLRRDSRKQPHVVQQYHVPTPHVPRPRRGCILGSESNNEAAVYSMWNHFVTYFEARTLQTHSRATSNCSSSTITTTTTTTNNNNRNDIRCSKNSNIDIFSTTHTATNIQLQMQHNDKNFEDASVVMNAFIGRPRLPTLQQLAHGLPLRPTATATISATNTTLTPRAKIDRGVLAVSHPSHSPYFPQSSPSSTAPSSPTSSSSLLSETLSPHSLDRTPSPVTITMIGASSPTLYALFDGPSIDSWSPPSTPLASPSTTPHFFFGEEAVRFENLHCTFPPITTTATTHSPNHYTTANTTTAKVITATKPAATITITAAVAEEVYSEDCVGSDIDSDSHYFSSSSLKASARSGGGAVKEAVLPANTPSALKPQQQQQQQQQHRQQQQKQHQQLRSQQARVVGKPHLVVEVGPENEVGPKLPPPCPFSLTVDGTSSIWRDEWSTALAPL